MNRVLGLREDRVFGLALKKYIERLLKTTKSEMILRQQAQLLETTKHFKRKQ